MRAGGISGKSCVIARKRRPDVMRLCLIAVVLVGLHGAPLAPLASAHAQTLTDDTHRWQALSLPGWRVQKSPVWTLVVALGASHIRIGLTGKSGRVIGTALEEKMPGPSSGTKHWYDRLVEVWKHFKTRNPRLKNSSAPLSIVISAPGVFAQTIAVFINNVPIARRDLGIVFRGLVEGANGHTEPKVERVKVVNDTAAAAWSELDVHPRPFLYVNVTTGLGVALVDDWGVVRTEFGTARRNGQTLERYYKHATKSEPFKKITKEMFAFELADLARQVGVQTIVVGAGTPDKQDRVLTQLREQLGPEFIFEAATILREAAEIPGALRAAQASDPVLPNAVAEVLDRLNALDERLFRIETYLSEPKRSDDPSTPIEPVIQPVDVDRVRMELPGLRTALDELNSTLKEMLENISADEVGRRPEVDRRLRLARWLLANRTAPHLEHLIHDLIPAVTFLNDLSWTEQVVLGAYPDGHNSHTIVESQGFNAEAIRLAERRDEFLLRQPEENRKRIRYVIEGLLASRSRLDANGGLIPERAMARPSLILSRSS